MKQFSGPLCFQTLEWAYQTITFGYNEPDILKGHPETLKRIMEMHHRFIPRPGATFQFNNAVLVESSELPENVLIFQNTVRHLIADSPKRKSILNQLRQQDMESCKVTLT